MTKVKQLLIIFAVMASVITFVNITYAHSPEVEPQGPVIEEDKSLGDKAKDKLTGWYNSGKEKAKATMAADHARYRAGVEQRAAAGELAAIQELHVAHCQLKARAAETEINTAWERVEKLPWVPRKYLFLVVLLFMGAAGLWYQFWLKRKPELSLQAKASLLIPVLAVVFLIGYPIKRAEMRGVAADSIEQFERDCSDQDFYKVATEKLVYNDYRFAALYDKTVGVLQKGGEWAADSLDIGFNFQRDEVKLKERVGYTKSAGLSFGSLWTAASVMNLLLILMTLGWWKKLFFLSPKVWLSFIFLRYDPEIAEEAGADVDEDGNVELEVGASLELASLHDAQGQQPSKPTEVRPRKVETTGHKGFELLLPEEVVECQNPDCGYPNPMNRARCVVCERALK